MSEKVLVIALLGPPLIVAVLQELRDAIMATDAFKPSERPCSLEIITAEEMQNAIGGASDVHSNSVWTPEALLLEVQCHPCGNTSLEVSYIAAQFSTHFDQFCRLLPHMQWTI